MNTYSTVVTVSDGQPPEFGRGLALRLMRGNARARGHDPALIDPDSLRPYAVSVDRPNTRLWRAREHPTTGVPRPLIEGTLFG